jgi:UDP-N-acetylglucosamine 4-epimerase
MDLSKSSFLITGGAGFIGSNLVEYLLKYKAGKVRVLDNLSNGYFDNIKDFMSFPNFEFINGDIRDLETCIEVVRDIDFISHQAALGSVPRSIKDPITSNEVNISGFLNILTAAKESKKLKRFVFAASSSTYGDIADSPKVEGKEGNILSPYAVTKLVNETYADVFSRVYGLNSIGLRYFNVFGPNQNPKNPYAAVIPIFATKIILNESPEIYGDGNTSRDFTFVENVVQANIKAFEFSGLKSFEVFNIACGETNSLNTLVQLLNKLNGSNINPIYKNERLGDIKNSFADISKAGKILGYHPKFTFEEGLSITFNHLKNNSNV